MQERDHVTEDWDFLLKPKPGYFENKQLYVLVNAAGPVLGLQLIALDIQFDQSRFGATGGGGEGIQAASGPILEIPGGGRGGPVGAVNS